MNNPLEGQHGAFFVYKSQRYYSDARSLVKVYVDPGDAALEQQIATKLYEMQMRSFPVEKWLDIVIQARHTKHPLTKKKKLEFSSTVAMAPAEALEWIKLNTDDLSLEAEKLDLGKDGWSVGPCITRQSDNSNYWSELPGLYGRIRFDKMSIPFYISNDKKVWDEILTRKAILGSRATRLAVDSIMPFLTTNKDEILKRIAERPFNKSGIAEYEPPHVSFFNKVGNNYKLIFHQGASNKVDQSKLADPKYKPVVTLRYRKQHGDTAYRDVIVAATDDKFYEVSGFTTSKGSWRGWTGDDVHFSESQLKELDPEDEYVRERAVRALRAKL